MTDAYPEWLVVHRGTAPLLLSMPHTGTALPADGAAGLVSPWLARRDADWWIEQLYDFGRALGATIVRTTISRTVIDVNRDPSGASLYPGQATTELCPTTTFDGEPLYVDGHRPDEVEIARRRDRYLRPYHAALAAEIARLREHHAGVVLYDCHSIRSVIPRLFDGELPQFNIGTFEDRACDPLLTHRIAVICAASGRSYVVNGRFKGGYITRHFGQPASGVHAVQMELACRGYMTEPEAGVSPDTWPTPFDASIAAPMQAILRQVLDACLDFASTVK